MRKLSGMIRLFRLELSLAAGICVTAGQILALGGLPSARVGILGFLCAFCLSSAAVILNDYFDFEVDKVNHPDRPLPAGMVSRTDVVALTAVTSVVGLVAASALGWDVLLISIVFWLIGLLYNWRYKESGLLGNLMVSASVAVTFLLGAITVSEPWSGIVWVFSIMALFIDLGEEIAGDAMDMEGDKKRGSRSIALKKGKAFALRVSTALWGMVILIGFVPLVFGLMGTRYLMMILIIDAVIVFFTIRLLRSESAEAGRQAMRGIYLGATLCIVAFLAGQFIK
jgi:geranylgeranylglycerol-phosphate geranylgeranyltransferase